MLWRLRNTGILDDHCGGAAVEYALLLSIAVGGFCLLGEAAHAPLARVGRSLGAQRDRPLAFGARVADRDVPIASETVAVAGATSTTPSSSVRWDIPLLAIIVASGCPIWHQIRRRRRRCAIQAEVGPLAAVAEKHLPPKVFQKRQAALRFFSENLAAIMKTGVQVRHAMSRPAMSVLPNTPIEAVEDMMADHAIRHVLVCDESGKVRGVVSDRDLRSRKGKSAADRMTRSPLTVSLDTQIVPAITAMIGRGVSCLPVVHEGTCEGILTVTDVAITLQCLLQIMEKAAGSLHHVPQAEN